MWDPHDEQRLMEIIGTNYPDLRSIAQKVDFEFAWAAELLILVCSSLKRKAFK